MVSLFRSTLLFLDKIGIFDVVIPFLLVFSIMFALLEKTQLFGTEKFNGKDMPRKNVNALVSFSMAFLVVASAHLVQFVINVSSQAVILILLLFLFMLLYGMLEKEGEGGHISKDNKYWKIALQVLFFVGLLLIFLNALQLGKYTALQWAYLNVVSWGAGSGGEVAGAVIMFVIVGIIVAYVIREPKKAE